MTEKPTYDQLYNWVKFYMSFDDKKNETFRELNKKIKDLEDEIELLKHKYSEGSK